MATQALSHTLCWSPCVPLPAQPKARVGLQAPSLWAAGVSLRQYAGISRQRQRGRVQCTALVADKGSGKKYNDAFTKVRTELELRGVIKALEAAQAVSPAAAEGLETFYKNYRNALLKSGRPDAIEAAVRIMGTVFDRILLQFVEPFNFPSYHIRIREPYDYYMFGQNYVQGLIDYSTSYVGNLALFDKLDAELKQGHNVVLLANHQTEADPGVMALMLETTHPYLAENLTYVAGDRVVLDPQCKPFSMGRNLLCVFSKKRINDVPELADEKMRANRRTLIEMSRRFNAGGMLVWVAPSGGRDRPDPKTGKFFPAAFDPSSVELMRRLVEDAPVPGHLYPLALLCHDIMPPPPKVVKELGEERIIGYHGVGISVAPELDVRRIVGHFEDKKEARDVLSEASYRAVEEQYAVLEAAIHEKQGHQASTPNSWLEQPFVELAEMTKSWKKPKHY